MIQEVMKQLQPFSEAFQELALEKGVSIISHFDTDGITSAAILLRALQRKDIKFSVTIVKQLDSDLLGRLPSDQVILFLDLGSGHLNQLKDSAFEHVFILDHHEITQEVPEPLHVYNPFLFGETQLSASALSYAFALVLDKENVDLAKLALLGMIGDSLVHPSFFTSNEEIIMKKGLLLYPSTRPIDKILEFSSHPVFSGITGDPSQVKHILDEARITPTNGTYTSVIDLDADEVDRLVSLLLLKHPQFTKEELFGDVYLMKFYGMLEDAREMSAKINACSRGGNSTLALQLCLERPLAKKEAEALHVAYRRQILSGLKALEAAEQFSGEGFHVFHAKDSVSERIIGTLASILTRSRRYEKETMLFTMAYASQGIKISARNTSSQGRNVRDLLNKIVIVFDGTVGGHRDAAGAVIAKEHEEAFLLALQKELEIETVRVAAS